jgi:hypothetical protein
LIKSMFDSINMSPLRGLILLFGHSINISSLLGLIRSIFELSNFTSGISQNCLDNSESLILTKADKE